MMTFCSLPRYIRATSIVDIVHLDRMEIFSMKSCSLGSVLSFEFRASEFGDTFGSLSSFRGVGGGP